MLSSSDGAEAITYPTARNDGWVSEASTSGGGGLSGGDSNDGLFRLATFVAGDAITTTRRLQASKAAVATSWDAPRAIEFVVDVSPPRELDADPDPPKTLDGTVAYFCTGDPAGGRAGFGFKVSGGTLAGVTHDGSSEQTFALDGAADRVPDRGPMRLRASTWADAGAGGPVRFHRGGSQVGQSAGASVPDGDSGTSHEVLWSASLDNQTNPSEARLVDVDAAVRQEEA